MSLVRTLRVAVDECSAKLRETPQDEYIGRIHVGNKPAGSALDQSSPVAVPGLQYETCRSVLLLRKEENEHLDGFTFRWVITHAMARVPLLSQTDLPEAYRYLFEVNADDPADFIVNAHRAMANNPKVLESWSGWASTLYDEVGDGRMRELVILAVASATDTRYVWHQHVSIGLEEGISQSEILAISEQEFDGFSPVETAVLEYATAVATEDLDPETHAVLADHVDPEMIITLVFLVAEYVGISLVIDAIAIEMADEFVGWQLEHLD